MSIGQDSVLSSCAVQAGVRTVVLASADAGLRERLRASLVGLRWQVREAGGGAEAMAQLEDARSEALLVDSWLPDLEVGEFASVIRMMYPAMELLRVDGGADGGARSPRRNELLHALREAQEAPPNDTAAWAVAPVSVPVAVGARVPTQTFVEAAEVRTEVTQDVRRDGSLEVRRDLMPQVQPNTAVLPEMVGASAPM